MRMKSLLAAAFFAGALPCLALAQTSPNLSQGQVLTPGQWNNLFASKQDNLGYTPLNSAGGVVLGRLVTAPPSAATSGLNLTPGSTPGSPANGDLWVTTSGFFAEVNGVTIGPIGGATSSSFANTSPITLGFPSGVVTYGCPTCGVTGSPLSQFAATTSAQLAGIISDETGSGGLVFATSPTLVTPILGVAAATSINKVAITAPATSATLTIANGKTLTASNSVNFTGTDGSSVAFGAGGTIAYTANNLSVFAATTSAQLAGIISDESGSGSLIFGTSPTIVSPTITTSLNAAGLVTFADMAAAAVATQAQYFAGTANTLVSNSVAYTAEQPLTQSGATLTLDGNTFLNAAVTLSANITTQTATNFKANQVGQIRYQQPASGGPFTAAGYPSIFKFPGGAAPVLSTAASAVDALEYSCVSSTYCVASMILNVK